MPKQHEQFIKDLSEVIETNLANDQFGVSELAREMGMSRPHIPCRLKKAKKICKPVSLGNADGEARELMNMGALISSEFEYYYMY